MTGPKNPLKNRLLLALPPDELSLLSPHLLPVELERGRLLYDPGDRIDTIYFPHDCVISLMTLMENGSTIESAAIGREGALGPMAGIVARQSLTRALVQSPGLASRLGVGALLDLCPRAPVLRGLIDRHNEALFGHAIQSVACNALHAVEARFCRWLLSCQDRMSADTVHLTQEFLADMLGVQRTTVTAVAGSLQTKGLIRYRRGVVDILDRPGLESMACECYRAVRRGYERLLPTPFG